MTCCLTDQVLLHYTTEAKTYYADLGEAIRGRTITGVTSITSDDALLTMSSLAVIGADVSEYDQFGNPITIEANTGVSWLMSGGTNGVGLIALTLSMLISISPKGDVDALPEPWQSLHPIFSSLRLVLMPVPLQVLQGDIFNAHF